MNRTYCLVWNRALRMLQVASELARSHGGTTVGATAASLPRRHPLAIACIALLTLGAFSLPAWAQECVPSATQTCGSQGGNGGVGDGAASGQGGMGNGGGGQGAGGAVGAIGTGGNGGAGSYGDVQNPGGAGGSVGATSIGSVSITGGDGVTPPTGGNYSRGGGGGGGGGDGVYTTDINNGLAAGLSITGGNGGNGAPNDAQGGGGGGGGAGVVTLTAGAVFTNAGSVTGGKGGNGAETGWSGGGGGGGDGVLLAGANSTLNNSGTITGGDGGTGPQAGYVFGTGGTGGSGVNVTADNTQIINSGTITAGLSANGTTRADAVKFWGTGESLDLEAGSTLNGAVEVINGASATISAGADGLNLAGGTPGGDALIVDGATTIDTHGHALGVSGIVSGSAPLTVDGGGTLTLSGTNIFSGGTTVAGGTTLSVSSDANLGAAPTASLPNQGALTLDGGTLANTQAFTTARNITLGTNNGTFDTAADLTVSGVISGPGMLFKQGAGTLTLTQANTYFVGPHLLSTELDAGTLQIDNVGALGSGGLLLAGGTLLANTTGTLANDITTIPRVFSATIAATTGNTLTLTGKLVWQLGSHHFGTATDTGTVVWNPVSYGVTSSDALFVDGGTLQLGAGSAGFVPWIEATTVASGATLDLDDQSGVIIRQLLGGGTVTTGSNATTVLTVASGSFTGGIQGAGGLTLACDTIFSCVPGVLTLGGGGLATYGGPTTITNTYTLQGSASDAFSAASATTVDAGGVLDLGGFNQTIGSLAGGGSVINSGSAAAMLTVGGDNTSTSFGGVIQDGTAAIGMQKTGTGSLTLDGINTYTGLTEVQDGALIVGDATHATAMVSGNTQVGGGATLGGFGTAGGVGNTVAVESGGTLSPGAGSNSLGTLNVGGGLTLAQGSVLDFDFGAPAASNPNTTPGLSDHVAVAGTLTFDGGSTLNINDAGGMGPGLYNLASYGSLAMNNCAIGGSGTQCVALGSMPAGTKPYNFTVINNTQSKQVDLYDTAGMTLNIWDPSGNTSQLGGTGTWTMTSSTWTDPAGDGPAAMTPQPGFAIFQGTQSDGTACATTACVVTVDDGTNDANPVSVTGMQFAVDGYTLTGNPLTLVGTTSGNTATPPIIEVGDGSSASAGMTATISANLVGTDGFTKTGAGTLALTAPFSVSGLDGLAGTVDVEAGTLQVGTTSAQSLQDVAALRDPITMAAGSQLVLASGGVDPYSGWAPTAPVVAAVNGQDFSITTSTTGTGTISAIVGIVPIGATQGADAGSAIAGTGFTATFTGNTFVVGSLTTFPSLPVGAAAITGSNFRVTNANASGSYQGIQLGITGGMGAISQSGTGGTGGAGISGSGFTVTNSGDIFGGVGGPTQTGTGGAGGAGIGGSGFTVTNTGKITGGVGGGVYAVAGYYAPGKGTLTGQGGAGVSSLGGATVINEGTISGGQSGAGLTQGDAIDFTGGGNTLELVAGHPGTFNGAIVVTRAAGNAADTLALGGDTGSDTFDLSQLASGAIYGGFNAEAKSGGSTWTLTGTGSTSENWTITGGTLVGNATALQGNIAFAPASGATATVEFDQTTDGTFAGAISGDGGLTKTGTGTLTLTGANTSTGATTISAGTLQVGNGGTSGALGTGAIIDNGALVFDRSDAAALPAGLTGAGSLVQQGSGTFTVNGDDSGFAGTTTVKAGIFTVGDDSHPAASLGGMVTIAKGATLTGIGTIGGLDLSGTLSPGGSIGTFHVTNDATFEAGSTFSVEANADGAADQLAVGGKTTIKGGNTVVLSQPGNWAPQTSYTLITSGGGVTGTFTGVSDNQAFLTPTLTYDANNVKLTLSRNQVSFPSVGTTLNQKDAATGIEGLGFGNPLYDAVVKLTAADAQVAFDQTSGEYHASQQTARIEDSRYIREAMNQRLRAGDNDPEAAKAGSLSLWAHGFGHWGTVDGDGNAAKLADNGDGLLVGADMPVGAGRIGITGGATRNSLSVNDRNSWGRETSTWLGGFAGFNVNAFSLRGGFAYAWDQIPTHREVNFPGFADRLSGNATGDTLTGFVEGAWTFHFNQASVTPFLNVAHTKVETDASTEAGGPAALHAFDATTNVSFTTLGARGEVSLAHNLNLHGELGWQHAFGDTTPEADLQFVAGGPAFTEYGVPVAKNAGLGRIGLGWHQGNIAVSADYEGLAGGGVKDQAAKVSVSVTF